MPLLFQAIYRLEVTSLRLLEQLTANINRVFVWIAGFTLVAMMLFSVLNMILRAVYVPFGAMSEVIGWMAAITIAFSLSYTQAAKAHVAIDILITKFPEKLRKIFEAFIYLLSTALFSVATWQLFFYTQRLYQNQALSETLRIQYYPFVFGVTLGLAALTLVLLLDFLKSFLEVVKE